MNLNYFLAISNLALFWRFHLLIFHVKLSAHYVYRRSIFSIYKFTSKATLIGKVTNHHVSWMKKTSNWCIYRHFPSFHSTRVHIFSCIFLSLPIISYMWHLNWKKFSVIFEIVCLALMSLSFPYAVSRINFNKFKLNENLMVDNL